MAKCCMAKCSNLGYDFTRLDTGLKEIIAYERNIKPSWGIAINTYSNRQWACINTYSTAESSLSSER